MASLPRTKLTTPLLLFILGVVIANVGVDQFLRGVQMEVSQRQKFVQDTVPLEALNREIVQALAQLSSKNNDEEIRKLLADKGISFSVTQPSAVSGADKPLRSK